MKEAAPPEGPSLRIDTFLRREFRHGLILLFLGSGLGVLVALAVQFGRRQGLFEPQIIIELKVPNGQGLRPGSPVRLSGVTVGVVQSLALRPTGDVALRLRLPAYYKGLVSPSSVGRITQDSLLGDRLIDLAAAPRPAAGIPDTFAVGYRAVPTIEQLMVGLETSRELPPTAAAVRRTGARAQEATQVMTTNLEQIKPELLQALKEVEDAAAQSRILLETLNGFLGDARPAPPRSQ
jgi:ABC-type transporter Mla subunit MlaD